MGVCGTVCHETLTLQLYGRYKAYPGRKKEEEKIKGNKRKVRGRKNTNVIKMKLKTR